jgi:hypothetical protein
MRAKFIDSSGARGTMDFDKVGVGDHVQFESDFAKTADDYGPGLHISEGDKGRIVRVRPDGPFYVVQAMALVEAEGGRLRQETRDVVVTPDDVSILVDLRDRRLPSHRYATSVPEERRAAFRRMSRALLRPSLTQAQREALQAKLEGLLSDS